MGEEGEEGEEEEEEEERMINVRFSHLVSWTSKLQRMSYRQRGGDGTLVRLRIHSFGHILGLTDSPRVCNHYVYGSECAKLCGLRSLLPTFEHTK